MAGGERTSKNSNKSHRLDTGDEETLFSFSQVKEFLKIQESSIKSFFTVIVDSNNTRIDNIFKEVQAIRASLEYTQAELADLKKINCQKRLESIESTVNILVEKADDLENRSRRNNLCFEGIDETGYDNWEKSEEKVMDLISSQLELDTKDIVIERAHRVGKKRSGSKPRPIIAKFLCYKDREKVLKARRKLKGTSQTIREDFSERILQKRKELLPKMNAARQEGKIAYLSYDKLVIRDRTRYPRHYPPGHLYNPPFAGHMSQSFSQPMFASFGPDPGLPVPQTVSNTQQKTLDHQNEDSRE